MPRLYLSIPENLSNDLRRTSDAAQVTPNNVAVRAIRLYTMDAARFERLAGVIIAERQAATSTTNERKPNDVRRTTRP